MIRLSEKIVDNVRAKIFNGAYKKGERLPAELDLAKEHDVSRSVIRESLRNLESLGLVTIKKGPKGGIFVAEHYHKPISDSLQGLVDHGQVSEENIFDIRLLLETYAAAQAAVYADEKDIKDLSAILCIPDDKRSDAKWMQSNRSKFHLGLAKASKNPVLQVLMNGLILLLRTYFKDFHDVEFELKSLVSHSKILDCIKNRDSEMARALMEAYIIGMRDFLHENYPYKNKK